MHKHPRWAHAHGLSWRGRPGPVRRTRAWAPRTLPWRTPPSRWCSRSTARRGRATATSCPAARSEVCGNPKPSKVCESLAPGLVVWVYPCAAPRAAAELPPWAAQPPVLRCRTLDILCPYLAFAVAGACVQARRARCCTGALLHWRALQVPGLCLRRRCAAALSC